MLNLKHILSIALLAVTTNAVASGVSAEMFQMNRQLNQFFEASSSEDFNQYSDKFIEAAKQAKDKMPNSLNGDQEKFKGYQQGIQEVINVVEQAKVLASQGKLDEAKAAVKQLHSLKKQYHMEYK